MATLRVFASSMRQAAVRVEQATLNLHRNLTVQVATALAENTPIDTGEAKSNWVTSVGTSYAAHVEAYAPGRFGSTRSANVQAVIQQAIAAAAAIRQGSVSYVTNNAPYIVKLNNGSSQQAPAGFVEASVQNAVATAAAARFI